MIMIMIIMWKLTGPSGGHCGDVKDNHGADKAPQASWDIHARGFWERPGGGGEVTRNRKSEVLFLKRNFKSS